MRWIRTIVLVAGLTLSACAASDPVADGPDTGAAAAASIGLDLSMPGPRLVDGEGNTLYLFTEDEPGVSTCEGGCLAAWPAVLTDADPIALEGVDAALLGTLERADGGTQVTYAGWPLYRYAADAAPGDATGQGVGGVWFVVAPDGTGIDAPTGGSAGSDMPSTGGGYEY